MTTTKFCKTCGKIMWDVQPTKRYCDSCIRLGLGGKLIDDLEEW